MDHPAQTHGLRDIIYRCQLCRTTFDKVHRLECHVSCCKAGKRPPSAVAYPFKCETCTHRFLTKSGLSQHERHWHPEIANQCCIDATKPEAEQNQEKRLAAKEPEKREVEKE